MHNVYVAINLLCYKHFHFVDDGYSQNHYTVTDSSHNIKSFFVYLLSNKIFFYFDKKAINRQIFRSIMTTFNSVMMSQKKVGLSTDYKAGNSSWKSQI